MNPYAIIGGMAIIFLAGAGGFKLGIDHTEAAQAREDKHIQEAIKAANTAAAEAIAGIKVTNTTIQGKVQREIVTNTVYADCKHTDDSLRLINQAITGSSSVDSKLPKTDATK